MMTFVQFPSTDDRETRSPSESDHIARIADAVYRVALKHGFTGSFVDLELAIWSTVRDEFSEGFADLDAFPAAESWPAPKFDPRRIKG
jgi:hypothetical protein